MNIEFLYKELDNCIKRCNKLEKECAEGKDYFSAAQYKAMTNAYRHVRYNIVPVFKKLNENLI